MLLYQKHNEVTGDERNPHRGSRVGSGLPRKPPRWRPLRNSRPGRVRSESLCRYGNRIVRDGVLGSSRQLGDNCHRRLRSLGTDRSQNRRQATDLLPMRFTIADATVSIGGIVATQSEHVQQNECRILESKVVAAWLWRLRKNWHPIWSP